MLDSLQEHALYSSVSVDAEGSGSEVVKVVSLMVCMALIIW